jgi:hypothetical protein
MKELNFQRSCVTSSRDCRVSERIDQEQDTTPIGKLRAQRPCSSKFVGAAACLWATILGRLLQHHAAGVARPYPAPD